MKIEINVWLARAVAFAIAAAGIVFVPAPWPLAFLIPLFALAAVEAKCHR